MYKHTYVQLRCLVNELKNVNQTKENEDPTKYYFFEK